MERTSKKRLAIVLLVVLVVVVIGAGITPVIISLKYENAIRKKIPQWVMKASDSLYSVTIDDISISTFTKNITATGVKIKLDSNKLRQLSQAGQFPPIIFSAQIDRVELNKIQWADLLRDKELSLGNALITHPVLKMYRVKPIPGRHDRPKKKQKLEGVNAGHIRIVDPEISFRRSDDSISFLWKGGQIEFNKWEFDVDKKKSDFFYAQSGNVKLDSAVLEKPGSLYAFRAGIMSFSSTKNSLLVKDFSIRPAMSKEEYYRRVGYQDELFTIICPSIEFIGFDWEQLPKGMMRAKKITAVKPYVNVYISRIPPPAAPKIRKFPAQQIKEMKSKVLIDTFEVKNGDISYTELNDKSKQAGTVPFKKFNAVFVNITNIDSCLQQRRYCTAAFNTNLFGTTLYSTFRFDLATGSGAFEAEGRQMGIDGTNINPLTRPVAMMEIKSLNLHEVNFHLSSNGSVAKGDFLFLYDDLKMSILKADEDGHISSRGLASFIINNALIYPSNPMPGKKPRRIYATIRRDPYKSFFNYLWTSIRTGALLTAGRNSQVVDVIANRSKLSADKRRSGKK